MIKEETLHLTVVDDSSNDAETISNLLRNAGHAVRTARVEDDADLRQHLDGKSTDMVLAKLTVPYFNAVDALGVVKDLDLDVPLVVIADGSAPGQVVEALSAGARDVVSLADPERLRHVIFRELHDLRIRNQYKECAKQLEEVNQRAQKLADTSRDAITYVHEGMHIYANESYLQLFGYNDFAQIEGMPVMNMLAGEEQGRFKDFLRDYAQGKAKAETLSVRGLRADEGEFQVEMEFSLAGYEGERCIQILIRDQSVSKELEQRLNDISKQDLLTGVYNRPYFLESLQKAVQEKGVLLSIEPDAYRALKEEIGLAASDLLLADVAGVMNQQLLPGELIARFEGHVFTALLPGLDVSEAEQRAKSLLKAVEDNVADISGSNFSLTVSIGVVAFDANSAEAQELLDLAERARQTAASRGGNTLIVHSPEKAELAEKEQNLLWTKRLKLALRDGKFQLAYQPILRLQGNSEENYQVLLRMVGEEQELIMPSEFMPAAEQAGLMVAIDRWVLGHTAKALAMSVRNGKQPKFFVKLSQPSLRDPQLLPWLRELLRVTGIDAESLTLEISELTVQANIKAVKVLLEGLRQLRIRAALDHFGMGNNSENLLKHLDTDFLKIHGNLIKEVAREPEQLAKMKELIALAKGAGRLTIAEYVEDAATLAALWSTGVDYAQGHFIAPVGFDLNYDFDSQNEE